MYCSWEEKIGFQIMTDNALNFLKFYYLSRMQRYVQCGVKNISMKFILCLILDLFGSSKN